MPERIKLPPSQRRRCNRLIKRLCANYDDGNCLLLDDGEPCVCPQTISYSLLCRYFRNAVLPADKELYARFSSSVHMLRRVRSGFYTQFQPAEILCRLRQTNSPKAENRKRTQTEKWNVRHRKSLKNQGLQPPIGAMRIRFPTASKSAVKPSTNKNERM